MAPSKDAVRRIGDLSMCECTTRAEDTECGAACDSVAPMMRMVDRERVRRRTAAAADDVSERVRRRMA